MAQLQARVGVSRSAPGGDLRISVADDWSIRMTGPAEEVYAGTLSADLVAALLAMGGG